ncbi:MAG: hypothetical protein QY323_04530 [Patescibacteria group bacterium]|nr:MAG: hypothetical protein QY323_04530 [Patescibacteria group bacterium]
MYALFIPIVGLLAAFGLLGLWIRFITRPRKALLSGGTFPLLAAATTETERRLDAQDRSEAAKDKAERLKQLHDEHEQLRVQLAANELETMRLDHELNPRTERDAYRDRHLLPDVGVPEDKSP